jgi:acyl carrier protein
MSADHAAILAEISSMLEAIRGHPDPEITMETSFSDDLGLDSIQVIALAGRLQAKYANTVNLTLFTVGLEGETLSQLRVGALVEYIAQGAVHAR